MTRFRRIEAQQGIAFAERAARELASHDRVHLVYLFGSALDPSAAPIRDVDIAVLAIPPLSVVELTRLRADLVGMTGAPIDLVSLNDAPIVLAKEVADSGRCLFARTPDAEVEFVTRARARYWDFKPYLVEQWRLVGARLEERRGGTET
jgi:predicted nucleotidyltransferase